MSGIYPSSFSNVCFLAKIELKGRWGSKPCYVYDGALEVVQEVKSLKKFAALVSGGQITCSK